MFTRLTATVTMSAPDAACACAMTACEGYLPVPTMSRDLNVRPAITNGVSIIDISAPGSGFGLRATSSDEVHDFNPVALVHQRVGEGVAPEDLEIVLDGHAARVDRQPRQQIGDGQRLVDFEGFPVERDEHRLWSRMLSLLRQIAASQGKLGTCASG